MLYNNDQDKSYIRMYRDGKAISEFPCEPLTSTERSGLEAKGEEINLKAKSRGRLDPRKIDYFQVVQKNEQGKDSGISDRVYIGDVFFPLTAGFEDKVSDFYKTDHGNSIGSTGHMVLTAGEKTIPLCAGDRVVNYSGDYVYPFDLVPNMNYIPLPFSYQEEQKSIKDNIGAFLNNRWNEKQIIKDEMKAYSNYYRFASEADGEDIYIFEDDYIFGKLQEIQDEGDVGDKEFIQLSPHVHLGSGKVVLDNDFFKRYSTYIKMTDPRDGSEEIYSEGPYYIGDLLSKEEYLESESILKIVEDFHKNKDEPYDLDSLKSKVIHCVSTHVYFVEPGQPFGCCDYNLNISDVSDEIYIQRSEVFGSMNNFSQISRTGKAPVLAKQIEDAKQNSFLVIPNPPKEEYINKASNLKKQARGFLRMKIMSGTPSFHN